MNQIFCKRARYGIYNYCTLIKGFFLHNNTTSIQDVSQIEILCQRYLRLQMVKFTNEYFIIARPIDLLAAIAVALRAGKGHISLLINPSYNLTTNIARYKTSMCSKVLNLRKSGHCVTCCRQWSVPPPHMVFGRSICLI